MKARKRFRKIESFENVVRILSSKISTQKKIREAFDQFQSTPDDFVEDFESTSFKEINKHLDEKSEVSFGLYLLGVEDFGINFSPIESMDDDLIDYWADNFFKQLIEMDSPEKKSHKSSEITSKC